MCTTIIIGCICLVPKKCVSCVISHVSFSCKPANYLINAEFAKIHIFSIYSGHGKNM